MQALARARRQRLEGINAKVVDSKLAELEGEAATHMTAMCPVYAMIILEHARYRQPHEDMLFFEALYKVQQMTSTVIIKMSERAKSLISIWESVCSIDAL